MPRPWSCVLVVLCVVAAAEGQSILTYAGGGTIDGRKATELFLPSVFGVALDAARNVYFTSANQVIAIDAATGLSRVIAGNGSHGFAGDGRYAPNAELAIPRGLAFDASGNLYICDVQNSRIRRVDLKTMTITTVAGGGNDDQANNVPATSARLVFPDGIAISRGSLYIGEYAIVRRVDLATGIISTFAGTGTPGFSGDNQPATQAQFNGVAGVAADAAGNVFVSDRDNERVRRIDGVTGIVTTYAGGGNPADGIGDGLPAAQAALRPFDIAASANGDLYVIDGLPSPSRIRRIAAQTTIISTTYSGFVTGLSLDMSGALYFSEYDTGGVEVVNRFSGTKVRLAGGGTFVGDGLVATAAILAGPKALAFDASGNLLIGDDSGLVRRVSAKDGTITTIAGDLLSHSLFAVDDIAVDAAGTIYIADDRLGRIYTLGPGGQLFVYAGGGAANGDGVVATAAAVRPFQLAFDPAGNLYFSDFESGPGITNRIRRIDAKSKIVTTIAGNGKEGYDGDGGPATAASLDFIRDMAFDGNGNLFVAFDFAIRKIDPTGIITMYAKTRGNAIAVHRPSGDVYVIGDSTVLKIDARTSATTIVAGVDQANGYSGDNGPALAATFSFAGNGGALQVRDNRDLYIADRGNNRVRAVLACTSTIQPPALTAPAANSAIARAPVTLSWTAVDRAFHYDVYLDAQSPPLRLAAADVASTSLSLANLQPGTTYYWSVTSKGDPFCPSVPTASSPIFSFTMASACRTPDVFSLLSPADRAVGVSTTPQLTWAPAAGAATYDVLLGTTNPPPVVASVTTTSFRAPPLTAGATYYWSVAAHATCNASNVTTTAVRSFQVGGSCTDAGPIAIVAPADRSANVTTAVTLDWTQSANASSYDVFFGTNAAPPIYLRDVTTTAVTVSGLTPGATYYWRVVAKIACDPTRTSSTAVASFTVAASCRAPQSPTITFAPPGNVAIGQTYVIAWKDVADLAPDGYYIVERSTAASFTPILDAQQTSNTSASFVSSSAGTYYHRVRAVNPCVAPQSSDPSPPRPVTVVNAAANVIFTVQPQAVVTAVGEPLEDKSTRFVVENIGTESVSVLLGHQVIDSDEFFTLSDPKGGAVYNFTLDPRTPKEFVVKFSGRPSDRPASYQAILLLAGLSKPLPVTPYAFINLRIGGSASTAPEIRKDGLATEYVAFDPWPFPSDDMNRPPLTVQVYNNGSSPMDGAAEIGPELWLAPRSGWNDASIAPGVSRDLELHTMRSRAPSDASAFPRYTYLTLRTKSGATKRLLVQDNATTPTANGRNAALDPTVRSFIVPDVVSGQLGGRRTDSVIRLSSLGSEPLTATLYFTPADVDGFDVSGVRAATISVPANDVVTLTDPLLELWNVARPARGQIEIRADHLSQLAVRAEVAQSAAGGGAYVYTVPVIGRGEGATQGRSHAIFGVSADAAHTAVLTLAETSGVDGADVRVTLYDAGGNTKGQRTVTVRRYSTTDIADVLVALGGGDTTISAGRLQLDVTGGGGAAIGVLKLIDRTNGGGTTVVSRPVASGVSATALASARARTLFLPNVYNGVVVAGSSDPFATLLGLAAAADDVTFNLTYSDGISVRTQMVTVAAKHTVQYANVLESLFSIPAGSASEGTLTIATSGGGEVYAELHSLPATPSRVSVSQELPIIDSTSGEVSTPESQHPLYVDGINQSVDPSRGESWSVLLGEIAGHPATLTLSLYESGNRLSPITVKDFAIAAFGRRNLGDLFKELDLSNADRLKDRANMLLSIIYKSGDGSVIATATMLDNITHDVKSYVLSPVGGAITNVHLATVVPTGTPPKRRAARH